MDYREIINWYFRLTVARRRYIDRAVRTLQATGVEPNDALTFVYASVQRNR